MPLVPNAMLIVGQPKRYIGRKFDPQRKEYVIADPYECEDGTPEAERCKVFVRRGEALPADAQTAKVCGVSFAEKKSTRKPKASEESAA